MAALKTIDSTAKPPLPGLEYACGLCHTKSILTMRALSTIFALLTLVLMLALSACGHEPSTDQDAQRTAQSVADSLLRADSLANAQDSTR